MFNRSIDKSEPIVKIPYASYWCDNPKVNNNKLNSCFGKGFVSNPISHKSVKEELFEKLENIKDPEIKQKLLAGIYGENPSEQFVEMLIERHEKKQAEFEEAWAEYQASKDNLTFYKKIFETLEKKYENSESDYENSLVDHANKNFAAAQLNSDIYLDIASSIAHRIT